MTNAIEWYILDANHNVVLPDSFLEGAKWFEEHLKERIVAQEEVNGVRISTVFIGLDHSYGSSSLPVVFETMIFKGPLDQEQDRYHTWTEAEAGHIQMVERVKLTA